MFANIVSLELRKQRQVVLSILFIAAVALTVGIVQSLLRRTDPLMSIMTVVLMGAITTPVVALVLGTAAGRGLRGEFRKSAEEMLPFDPTLRMLGAYIVSLIFFILLAALFLIPLSVDSSGAETLNSVKPMYPHLLLCMGLLYVHLIAFAFTYWSAQPVLGGGLAAVCTAMASLCTLSYTTLQRYPAPSAGTDESRSYMIAAIAVGCAAGIGALLTLARPVERSEKLRLKALAVGLALVCVPILTFGAVLWQVHILETTLRPMSFSWSLFDPESPLNYAPVKGALFRTPSGSVVRVTQDGTKQVLYQAPGISAFTQPPIHVWLIDLVTDQDGTTWLLLQPDFFNGPSTYEIRCGRPGEKLETYTTFVSDDRPMTWATVQGHLFLCTSKGGRRCAELPARGKLPQWKSIPESDSHDMTSWIREFRFSDAARSGNAAVFSPDRTSLILRHADGTETNWQLPGKAAWAGIRNYAAYAAPFSFGANESLYIVPVIVGERKERLVFCYPDGTVRDPWNRVWDTEMITGNSLNGGIVWQVGSWNEPSELLIVDRAGHAYPPVSVHDLYKKASIPLPDGKHDFLQIISLRVEDSKLWTVLQGTLIEIDLGSGKISRKLAELAAPSESVFRPVFLWPLDEGVYFIKDERIHLVDWNGTIRDLGKAEIPDNSIF